MNAGALNAGLRNSAELTFHVAQVRSEAVHVNTIEYVPDAQQNLPISTNGSGAAVQWIILHGRGVHFLW